MTITKVYFWGEFDSTGHVSVATDKYYMSFHPTHSNGTGISENLKNWTKDVIGVLGRLGTYSEDLEKHKKPTKIIEINWLDSVAMNNKINQYHQEYEKKALRYKLATHNCCTVAMELLCCGASEKFIRFKSISQLASSITKRTPFAPGHNHTRLIERGWDFFDEYHLMCPKRKNVGKLSSFLPAVLILDIVAHELIWTPGDVQIFAEKLAKKNHL